jgi:hypothetical protein
MPSSTWASSLEQTEESPLKASKSDSSKMVRHIWSSLTVGMDMSAIREIKYLQELQHENITEAYLTTMK